MAIVTLYHSGKSQQYPKAHDITVSPAGILTFYTVMAEGSASGKPRASRFIVSAPFIVEEDVAVS